MSNALTAQQSTALRPAGQFDLSPQSFEQALEFSKYLAASDMVPKQYRGKPGDCLIAMQWGYEIGMKPLQALQSIAAVNGRPSIYGDAGKAMLLAAGCQIDEDDIEKVRETGRARCKITRPGRKPTERTFSIEDAKTARLWGKEGPWTNYPYRQMAWRAFWFAARDAAADLLRGMGGAEELQDSYSSHCLASQPWRFLNRPWLRAAAGPLSSASSASHSGSMQPGKPSNGESLLCACFTRSHGAKASTQAG